MIIVSPLIKLGLKIATFVVYLITIFCCYGGYIPPEIFPLGSVAVIGMPVIVTLSAAIVILWLCFGRWIMALIGVGMFILCGAPIKMWFPMNSPTEAEPGAPVLTLLTWNALHGSDLEKPDYEGSRLLETILEVNADVVCLQEVYCIDKSCLTHFSQSTADSIARIYPYQLGDGTYDLRILSKYPLRHIYFGSLYSYRLAECFTVKTPTREIAMVNVHLPSYVLDSKEKQILKIGDSGMAEKKKLGRKIVHKMERTFPQRAEGAEKVLGGVDELAMPTIICGDFNDVPASWTYRLFLKRGFMDAYDATNFFPTHTFNTNMMYVHLDQIFYRGALRPLSVDRINIRCSDHYPLVAKFQILEGY
ncbi:MAG: endonuclease/exonuclease/phosphatase family protein [Muribaculaceae bacterium]|nr:endonuclease/exonuclease/phosphatase family protein [Muribaculaceae bacterium]